MACVLCNQKNFTFVFRPASVHDRALERCNACSLLQMKPMPDDDELREYYQRYDVLGEREPYYRDLWGEDALHTPEGRDVALRVQWLRSHINAPHTVLDVGSGPGLFLRIMHKRGANVEGVELNVRAAERSAREIGVPVIAGTIDAVQGKRYEVITLWDMVEHVNNPRALVRGAWERLTDDGWIFIETPNEAGLLDRAILLLLRIGITWPADTFYGMHHLALFRPQTIRRLLDQCGFEVVEIRGAQTTLSRIFRGKKIFDRLIRAGLRVLFFFARIVRRQNKMLIAARKIMVNPPTPRPYVGGRSPIREARRT